MNPWQDHPVPPMRREVVFGSRVATCFVERPRSLHAVFARAVSVKPSHEAIVSPHGRWTYQAADAEVGRIAARFVALGIGRGERVAMFIGNRAEFVLVLFALQRIGAIAVPIGIREARPALAWMLAQCGAAGIVFDAALEDRVPDEREVPTLRLRLRCEELGQAGAAGTESDVAGRGDAKRASRNPANGGEPSPVVEAVEVDEQDTAVILYTSGTTGQPKGAMLTHLNIAHSVRHFEACMRLGADERGALAVPASHVTGLIATIATLLHVGGTIVLMPEFKASEFIDLVERERITHTLMVPAMYKLCLLQPDFESRDLSSWRIGGYGGAPMPVATIQALAVRLPALGLVNAYGATETTSPATMMPTGGTAHADTVGVALPCARIVVMDDEGREAATGETGELWIGGPMVVPGYWDNAPATAASFTAGFWRSGDLGSIDDDGYVRIFDRKKDMLNRGGFKVYSVEVENALMAYAGVIEAAIVARPCEVLGERVHAFVHAPGIEADDAAVRAHCRRLLADYKVPETITWSATPLPRNANGKLLKRRLRDELLAAGTEAGPTSEERR